MNHLPDAGPPHDGPPVVLPAVLKLAPDSADFGSVVTGQSSTAMAFTVANIGEGETGTISAAISGGQGSNFTIDSTTCTTLAKAATCTVSVKFTPNAVGTKAAALAITSAPGGTVMASLQGIGIKPGALTITPGSNQFPNVVVGATAATNATFTVTNTGSAATGALTTTPGGANAGEFTKVTDTCNGQTLAAAATCTIVVGFSPATSGPKFASYSVTGTPGGTVSAAVNGLGLDNAQLFLNPTAQNFGSVVIGSTSADVTFSLVNIGGTATGAITQALTGTGAGSYTVVSSTCQGATLNPGANCTVVVHFNPTAAGQANATLGFTGTPGGTQNAVLTGTAVAPGSIQIAPSLKAYGNISVGQTSAPQDFIITNTGGTTTGAINTALVGADNTQFRITANGCQGVTLAANATCTITAVFAPGAAGAKQAQLTGGASPGGNTSAALSGNGIPAAALSISPTSHDFGSVGVGDTTGVQAFTIRNVGGSNTGIPTASLSGANPNQFILSSSCPAVLAPLQTCTVSVRFAPTTLGSDVATVDVVATPGGAVSANVFGEGVNPAALTVNPSSITFPGLTTIGDTSQNICSMFAFTLGAPLSICSADPKFVVTNNGTSATGPLAVTLQGANPGDFLIVTDTCNGQSLAGAAKCTVAVRFAPTARGDRTASVKVAGTPGGSVSVALAGTALPRLEVIALNRNAPFDNPYDWGNTTVLQRFPFTFFARITLTVRNNTQNNFYMSVNGANISSPDNGFAAGDYFEARNSCGNGGGGFLAATVSGSALAPQASMVSRTQKANRAMFGGGARNGTIFAGGTCDVEFWFIPRTAGASTGQAVFSIGSTLLDQATEDLKGNGVDGMYFSFDSSGITRATAYDFGNIVTGTFSPTVAVFLHNSNDAPPTGTLGGLALQFQQFGIPASSCTTFGLGSNQSCEIDAFFKPAINGFDHAAITITGTPGGSPTIDLRGTGVPASGLVINPTPVLFGDVISGGKKPVTVTVQNPAGAQTSGPFSFSLQGDSCGIGSFAPGGGAGSAAMFPCFSILTGNANDCVSGTPLSNGTSCVIRIQFDTANDNGIFNTKTASLSVSATPGLPSSPQSIPVSGNSRSEISITPDGALGTVQRGSPVTRTFTIRNDSAATVTLSGRSFFGPSTTDTSFVDGCANTVVPAGAACSVTLTYAPLADETLNATLSYTTLHGRAAVQVTGTGQAPNVEFTESFPTTMRLAMFPGSSHPFTLKNTGNGAATVASLSVTGDTTHLSIANDNCTGKVLAGAGGQCTVDLVENNVGCSFPGQGTLSAVVPNDVNGVQTVNVTTNCFAP